MKRRCSNCGTPLKQGFVKGNKLVCGRDKTLKTLTDQHGNKYIDEVKTTDCRW